MLRRPLSLVADEPRVLLGGHVAEALEQRVELFRRPKLNVGLVALACPELIRVHFSVARLRRKVKFRTDPMSCVAFAHARLHAVSEADRVMELPRLKLSVFAVIRRA